MKKIYKQLCRVEEVLAIGCLVAMTVIVFVAAILRAFGHPQNWSLDIALFLIAWGVFLGADVAYREDKLVKVDILTAHLPKKVNEVLEIIMELIILVFLVALIYYGIRMSIKTWNRTFQGIPGFSYTWVTLSVPVSGVLMCTTNIRNLIRRFRALFSKA